MARFLFESRYDVPAPELFAWHEKPGAFLRLAPPWERMRLVRAEGGIRDGGIVEFQIRKGPVWLTWLARMEGYRAGGEFTDVQERGPFAMWRHTHRFLEDGPGRSLLRDEVEFELPLGALGAMANSFMAGDLRRLFAFRARRLGNDLRRQHDYKVRPRLTVAISGASGLVGTALRLFLETGGHRVRPLVRRAAATPDEIAWDPAKGEVDAAALSRCDAVVNLSGASIAGRQWTDEYKDEIRRSRVDCTRTLAQALATRGAGPRVFVSASATGAYGDRGSEELTEKSELGEGFLADVARDWEAAAAPARDAGVRTVHPRIGVVLSAQGGALAKMLPAFLAGAGGPVGGGEQYMSWIHLDDLVAVLVESLFDSRHEGPLNATAPQPATNREFARALGRALGRPSLLPLPAAAVRGLFGEMGEQLLLCGNRVLPARLGAWGFRYDFADLEEALRFETGRLAPP
ncbi:MAG: TIGR01777 family oxidoreductase [Candidatus Sumerlaeia bacterium]|nr:TIGR01777 family oxidoreductase [Candidatus Sumerlaeia bacterium]